MSKSFLVRGLSLAAPIIALIGFGPKADALVLQGSTTFASTLMEPYGKAVEEQTGIRIEVVPNKSSLGLLALFEGRADVAMLSARLPSEIEALRATQPDLPYERLRTFEVARVPAAFVIHPSNPVRTLPLASVSRILAGEITNWREVGGPNLPIRVVAVRPGGGVLASVEAALFGKGHVAAPDQIRVQVGTQIVKVVAQEPGAIGVTQLSIVKRSQAVELTTDQKVEQVLTLVTFGEPSTEALRFIKTMQQRAQASQ